MPTYLNVQIHTFVMAERRRKKNRPRKEVGYPPSRRLKSGEVCGAKCMVHGGAPCIMRHNEGVHHRDTVQRLKKGAREAAWEKLPPEVAQQVASGPFGSLTPAVPTSICTTISSRTGPFCGTSGGGAASSWGQGNAGADAPRHVDGPRPGDLGPPKAHPTGGMGSSSGRGWGSVQRPRLHSWTARQAAGVWTRDLKRTRGGGESRLDGTNRAFPYVNN